MTKKKRLWHFIRNYKSNSLILRNFILIFLMVIIPLTGMGLVIYNTMNDVVENEISTISTNALVNTKEVVDTILRDADLMATSLSLDREIRLFFQVEESQATIVNTYKNTYNAITNFNLVHRYIDTIYIYSEINNYIISNRDAGPFDRFGDKSWYDAYQAREDNTPWVLPRKKSDVYPYYISIIRPAYLYNTERLGTVIINIDAEELGNMIGRNVNDDSKNIFIINENGIILYNNRVELIAKKFSDLELFDILAARIDSSSPIVQINEEHYVVSTVACKRRDWQYISLIPLMDYSEKVDRVRFFIMGFFIISIPVTVILAFILSLKSFAPLKNIISLLEEPSAWRELEEAEKENELKYIAGNIIRMVTSNEQLQQELQNRLVLLNKAHTAALQAQIKPHFLHNTLEAVNLTAARALGNKNEVSDIVANLSKLLRISLDTDEELIPIEAEIEHAKCYLDIMKTRYSDKFDVIWDIPQEILQYRTIKLSLQPILENAIYHGLKPKRQNGFIKIAALLDGNDIIFKITDNGVGMSSEAIQDLNRSLKIDYDLEKEHIGLKNIVQRLKLIFGEGYGLEVIEEEIEGLTVTMLIPQVGQL